MSPSWEDGSDKRLAEHRGESVDDALPWRYRCGFTWHLVELCDFCGCDFCGDVKHCTHRCMKCNENWQHSLNDCTLTYITECDDCMGATLCVNATQVITSGLS